MRTYRIDMIPGKVGAVINASQYDHGYEVQVTLYEGSVTYQIPSGASIRVEGTKSDAKGFSYECRAADGIVYVPIQIQMTAVQGDVPCELVVYKNGLRVGSCNFILAVEESALDGDTDISETDIPAIIAEATEQMEAAASSASQAAASATAAASSAASAETAKDAAMDAAQDAIDAAQELQTAIQFNAALIHETASGAVASFADGADNIPMQSVVAEITPVQSGSGDPSPTNIRPISGRTGLTVTAAGKNIADIQDLSIPSGTTLQPDISAPITLVAGTYTLSWTFTGSVTATRNQPCYNVDNVGVTYSNVNSTATGRYSWTFTLAEETTLVFRWWYHTVSAACSATDFMLEKGSTATAYEPYTAQTYPITWESIAGTVYGGTLDVVSGVLTVDRGFAELSEDWAWRKSSSYPGGYIVNRDVVPGTAKLSTPFVCSHAKTVTLTADYVFGTCYCDSSMNFRIMGESSTLQDWKDYIAAQRTAGTPVQICCYLATPQTYQLTPTEVRTILGENNIYTDAGDVSVEYIADTKMYIDNKIAELQALVLEN